MSLHRLSRMFALGSFAVAAAVLLSMAIVLQSPEKTFAQSAGPCIAPSFNKLNVTPAILNSPWSISLLSNIEGSSTPTVTATGLPPGIALVDQKITVTAGTTMLHNWVLTGAPLQLGTYTITVTAQNSCGGISSVITLPINNIQTAAGTVCPSGTFGTYPNCSATSGVSVAFDQSSLIASTSNPTITGTSNTAKVSLAVKNNTGNTYTSPLSQVSNGRWSIMLSGISTGTYSLSLYGENNILLILGTLIAAVPSTGSTAQPTQPIQSTLPVTLIPAAGAAGAGSCVQLPATTMQIGGKGTAVTNLQNFLIQRGLLASGSATGYFGPLTRAAVQRFQASMGIASSGDENSTGYGLVGARTRAFIGCQNSTPNAPPQPIQRISCPLVPQPVCGVGGNLISLGFDNNGCSLGKVCQQLNNPGTSCPAVVNPSCEYGDLVPLGYDYNGCWLGSQCQRPACNYIPQITSCPAGQTLVSGNDRYGCPNVSYCSGGGSGSLTPSNPIPGVICPAVISTCPAGTYNAAFTDLNGCLGQALCLPLGY